MGKRIQSKLLKSQKAAVLNRLKCGGIYYNNATITELADSVCLDPGQVQKIIKKAISQRILDIFVEGGQVYLRTVPVWA